MFSPVDYPYQPDVDYQHHLWITRLRPNAVKLDRCEATTGPQPVSATRVAEHDHASIRPA
jgi:hypothetical protein